MGDVGVIPLALATPIGLTLPETFSSFRSGIVRFEESTWMDPEGFFLTLSPIQDLCLPPSNEETERFDDGRVSRILRIASLCAEEVSDSGVPADVPLFLGLPELDGTKAEPGEVMFAVAKALGLSIDRHFSQVVPGDRASGLAAVKAALDAIRSGVTDAALVCGADSLIHYRTLSAIFEAGPGRLKSEGSMDGFIPGEGIGLVLLVGVDRAEQETLDPHVFLEAAAVGWEKGHFGSEEVYRGEGLSEALWELFGQGKGGGGTTVGTVFSSMNGESYWAKEWGVANIRFSSHLKENLAFEHPADCFGDLGAAAGPAMLALASEGVRQGKVETPALAYASSDHGDRAAILISAVSKNDQTQED